MCVFLEVEEACTAASERSHNDALGIGKSSVLHPVVDTSLLTGDAVANHRQGGCIEQGSARARATPGIRVTSVKQAAAC